MKFLRAFLLLSAFLFCPANFAPAQNADFPGVQKAMSPGAFEQAGLSKLSPEERARLDEFIRGYVAVTSEKAATAAVDDAVKNRKVKEPEIIESRLVGKFTGYTGRTRFALENGQVWAQAQQDSRSFPPVDSPPVLIVQTGLGGHRMYILGGGNLRVGKVR